MAAEAIHVPVTIGSTAIGEQNGDLMKRSRGQRPEVPHHRRRFQISLRVALLGVNEVTKFQRVADEKDWCVISDQVPIPFFGVKLQSKSAGVPFGVRRAFLAANG